jgi:YHS domain-containing protein
MRINWAQSIVSTFSIILGAFAFESAHAAAPLTIVQNEKVCMVTNMLFPKKQIPVTHDGKTYYGCCENCKKTLATDSKARTAVDPVSGKSVDKARAVIAARADHSVVYFENKKNFEAYLKSTPKGKPGEMPAESGHAHH